MHVSTQTARKPVTVKDCIARAAENHGVTPEQILGASKVQVIVRARQEAMYEARAFTKKSFPVLGRIFGKHHSSVIHAVNAHAERNGLPLLAAEKSREQDKRALQAAVRRLRKQIVLANHRTGYWRSKAKHLQEAQA